MKIKIELVLRKLQKKKFKSTSECILIVPRIQDDSKKKSQERRFQPNDRELHTIESAIVPLPPYLPTLDIGELYSKQRSYHDCWNFKKPIIITNTTKRTYKETSRVELQGTKELFPKSTIFTTKVAEFILSHFI